MVSLVSFLEEVGVVAGIDGWAEVRELRIKMLFL